MGLLHKNLILAGIASMAMVGFLGSSSASALDGFSFSDIINNRQSQIEALKNYFANPFGTECEAANPDSTISCNEGPLPDLLFNRFSDGDTLWGHDGKGIVFNGNENIVDNNPQLRTAKKGDSLNYSIKVVPERYYDDAEIEPIIKYGISGYLSTNLALNESSVVVKVGDQELTPDTYSLKVETLPEEVASTYGFSQAFEIEINWGTAEGTFYYDEGQEIEAIFSATIDQQADEEVFVKAACTFTFMNNGRESINQDMFMESIGSETYQATALLKANLVIERKDADGNPLAGVGYSVNDVKADAGRAAGQYRYNPSGSITEFVTDEDGEVVIKGVPIGEYEVTETSMPAGHQLNTKSIKQSLDASTIKFERTGTKYDFAFVGMPFATSSEKIRDDLYIAPGTEKTELSYSEEYGGYVAGEMKIYKDQNGDYRWERIGAEDALDMPGNSGTFEYNKNLEQYISPLTMIDYYGLDTAKDQFRGMLFFTDDGKAHADWSNSRPEEANVLDYSDSDGCYHAVSHGYAHTLCPEKNGYRLKNADADDASDNGASEFFEYIDVIDQYVANDYKAAFGISETENGILLTQYQAVVYSDTFDGYYYSMYDIIGAVLEVTRTEKEVGRYSVSYLFTEGSGDAVVPEIVTNPQTGDAVIKIKTIIIAVAGLVPVLMLRKRLTRR